MRLSALLLLAALLAACDGGFSGVSQDFDCVAGATATATVDGQPFAAGCVEVGTDAGLSVGAYVNPGATAGPTASQIRFGVPRRAVGTYAVASGATLSYSTSTYAGEALASSRSGTATSGQIVLTEATASQAAGTFTATAPEVVYRDGAYEPTGGTIVVADGAFRVSF